MKIKELIKKLKHMDEDDEIIVAYWSKDDIEGWYDMEHNPDMEGKSFSDDQWKKLVEKFDYNYDFQQVCDDIDDIKGMIKARIDDNDDAFNVVNK